jgi:hypothetical protein
MPVESIPGGGTEIVEGHSVGMTGSQLPLVGWPTGSCDCR